MEPLVSDTENIEPTYEKNIGSRLISVLMNEELAPYCLNTYINSFSGMGVDNPEQHAQKTNELLSQDKPLREREREIWEYLKTLSVHYTPFESYVAGLVNERRDIMFKQVAPNLLIEGKTLDFGAGNGEFMRQVHASFPKLDIEGWDVVSDDSKGQVQVYDGKVVPRDDKFYDQAYATTVLHHTADPFAGAEEMARLTKERLILIETIPGEHTGDRKKDWDITFVADYFWRLIHRSTEPVPGSYLTAEEWQKLFTERLGFKLKHFENLGQDQKTITVKHILAVFERTRVV
ncbi:MAG: methyltransferase domain-containing protein [Candidatus Paceibacterota bacterium]|jgi:ubiquinone/menaquinone biosynthesis C-methylase UbiE